VAHGDVDGLVALLQRLVLPTAAEELHAKAKAGRAALEAGLGRETLRARWADEVEAAIGAAA
jgi:hypothetical protein